MLRVFKMLRCGDDLIRVQVTNKEMVAIWKGIRFIFKLYFTFRVLVEKQLARRFDPATVQLLRLEDLFSTDVAHAAAIPVKGVVIREVGHEAPEVFNPGVVLVTIEQVDRPLIFLLRCIEWIAPLPLFVKE